ncbi:hypothetical protein ACF0H5_009487 [Mactra antiquata]
MVYFFILSVGNNTQCPPHLLTFHHSSMTQNGNEVMLVFSKPHLVQNLVINTAECDMDRVLIEGTFTVKYIDSSDASYQWITYSQNLTGTWHNSNLKIPFNEVLYTEQIVLVSSAAIQCSQVSASGCSTDRICHSDTCKNGGTCIGNEHCACAEGFIGTDCSETVADMTIDDYDIVAVAAGLLFTKDAPFSVSGDVAFTIDGYGAKRSPHGHYYGSHGLHHGNAAHFHGFGGSVSFSSSHLAGYTSGHHSNHGHHPSNNQYSALHSGQAFSHRCHFSIGLGHNHQSHHYLYTSHGHNHYSPGASLHYHNNLLHLHIHAGLHNHHFHVSTSFNPLPGTVHHIASSFSPIYGASILVNGLLSSHQPHPVVHPQVTLPQVNLGLCFGICSPSNPSGGLNLTMSNMVIAGASIPTLIHNNLLGILGNSMINLLVSQLFPQFQKQNTTNHVSASTTPMIATTTTPVKSTQMAVTATTNPTSGSASSVKPLLPVLTKAPASTTTSSMKTTTTASSHFGPICHDCFRQQTDGSCSNAMQCTKGEVCLAMHDRNGFTHRCVTQQDCAHGTLKATADCWYCCTTNLCNDRCQQGNSTTCQDDPQCASIKNLGSFYNVCADPALSTTTCKKTCNHCP